MTLPGPVETLWQELQAIRAKVLAEVEALTQAQADWRPDEKDWSVGEVLHHLTIAEVATGKLTTNLMKEAEARGLPRVFPSDLGAFAPLPAWPPGPMEAPPVVWPERGKSIGVLIDTMKATRERSRQSIEKLGTVDPRPLVFKHFRLGDLDLAQWWTLQAEHDAVHLGQIRDVKSARHFPKG